MRVALKVTLATITTVIAAAAGAAPTGAPAPMAAQTATKVEWDASTLDCTDGSYGVRVYITNNLSKEITGTIAFDGAKGDPIPYAIKAGQRGFVSARTSGGQFKCDAPLRAMTARLTGSAFPVAITHTYKPKGANYLEDVASPGYDVKAISVKKLNAVSGLCGTAMSFQVEVRNTTDAVQTVKMRLRYGSYDKTLEQQIFKSGGTFTFKTEQVLDCTNKGAPSVRYDMLFGNGQSGTVTPRYIIYSDE